MRLKGNDIYMVRGDTETITIRVKTELSDGSFDYYKLTSADTIVMYIGEWTGQKTSAPTFKKKISAVTYDSTTGAATISIASSDTSDLNIGQGQYVYTIKITFSSSGTMKGAVKHLFPAAWFVLEREVAES